MKEQSSIAAPLREAIVNSGIPFHQLEEATGVHRGSISRFIAGKRTLRLDMADKLAVYFELELQPKKKK